MLQLFWSRDELGIDFQQTLLPAAQEIAEGHSPYPAYGYPPLVAFALVPFTFLPSPELFYTVALLAGIPASLLILNVRDWRCYGAAFLWGCDVPRRADGQRHRPAAPADRRRVARQRIGALRNGLATGLAIATKIICWPLLVWLAATGRWRAAVASVVFGGGVTLMLWGALGFSGLTGYPSSLDKLESEQAPSSYTIRALSRMPAAARSVRSRGPPSSSASSPVFACRPPWADRQSFALAVLAATVASPIVWLHSFLLLLAPSPCCGRASASCGSCRRSCGSGREPETATRGRPRSCSGWPRRRSSFVLFGPTRTLLPFAPRALPARRRPQATRCSKPGAGRNERARLSGSSPRCSMSSERD